MESKFDFSDDDVNQSNKDSSQDKSKGDKSLFSFLKKILDFKSQTERDSTIISIKNDISIQGATAWILICSIFVASVGLNANSIPVVIGAMLISPLMGPILGFGMAIAINDIETLKKSTLNFIIMVLLSVFTAFLFFSFFPLREESSELLSRTKPDIRDVLIAFFGGLALIIARTKKGTVSSVIFGVAIATALMPPLCTVGFGLATRNFDYSLGAMYLFLINTLYIILATYLVIKFLGFPMINYANSRKRLLISRVIAFFSILMIIPALFTFFGVLNKSNFETSANNFIRNEFIGIENQELLLANASKNYDSNPKNSYWPWSDRDSEITINTFGMEILSPQMISNLNQKILTYPYLSRTKLLILQNSKANSLEDEKKVLLFQRTIESLKLINKNQEIKILKKELRDLKEDQKNNQ